jgi:glutamyl-tRNA synthetase
VPVLVNEQRKKLSKRRDKVALEQYRDEGYLAEAMVNYLMTLGWTPPGAEERGSEITPWAEMEAAFRLEDVTHSPAFFDLKKLAAFNGDYIRAMPLADFVDRAAVELPAEWDRDRFAAIAPHVQQRLTVFSEVPGLVDFLFWPSGAEIDYDPASWDKAFGASWAAPLLGDVVAAYRGDGPAAPDEWNADALKGALESVMAPYELKLGKAQAPVRVATTGRSVGPPLFESLEVLGRDETVRRLELAHARAGGTP